MMQSLKNDSNLLLLATRDCQHLNISCVTIVQDVFFGKRTSRVNSQYIVLMKNPSDKLQAKTLAYQLFPQNTKYFFEAFEDATAKPHGYLLIDLHQHTPDHCRLRTSIFPGERTIIYTPINKSSSIATDQL
jgi:hypothetical protein